jgi:hypothetical protein
MYKIEYYAPVADEEKLEFSAKHLMKASEHKVCESVTAER